MSMIDKAPGAPPPAESNVAQTGAAPAGPSPFEMVLAWLGVLVLLAAIAFVITATIVT